MSRKRPLSADEHALWTVVTRSIAPLRRRKAAAAKEITDEPKLPPAPPAKRAKKPALPVPVAPVRTAPPSPPPLAPLGRRMRQKIGRGSEPIDARIDLHGMRQDEAHSALAHFLMRAQRDGARVVLVITGKGARNSSSPGSDPHAERGVLKRQVPMWLESPDLRPLVVGFETAGIGHGGAGALYVRVRRGR
jgi:DNA-nicking Smr family endonuclease